METLTINIPEDKSNLVKQILKELGVTIKGTNSTTETAHYKQKISTVTTWKEEDMEALKTGSKSFEDLKPEQW